MNKKLLKLLFAVAIMSIVFMSCNNNNSTSATNAGDSLSLSKPSSLSGKIVYLNSDSLVASYDLFKELNSKYEEKATKVEKELDTKSKAWERKAKDLQDKASKGLITRAEGERMQTDLQLEQQTILEFRDNSVAELREEEQVMFNNVRNDIDVYLKKYNQEKGFDMILSTNSISNTVMIANPVLDITKEVVEGLNKEYTARKAAAKK